MGPPIERFWCAGFCDLWWCCHSISAQIKKLRCAAYCDLWQCHHHGTSLRIKKLQKAACCLLEGVPWHLPPPLREWCLGTTGGGREQNGIELKCIALIWQAAPGCLWWKSATRSVLQLFALLYLSLLLLHLWLCNFLDSRTWVVLSMTRSLIYRLMSSAVTHLAIIRYDS
jgi:hypothetical protein